MLLTSLLVATAAAADGTSRRIIELEFSTGQRDVLTLHEWLGSLYLPEAGLPVRDLDPAAVSRLQRVVLPGAGACYRLDDLGRYQEIPARAQATLQLDPALLRKRTVSARPDAAPPVPLQQSPGLALSYLARAFVQNDQGQGSSLRYGIEPLATIGLGRYGSLSSTGFIGNVFSRRGDTTYRLYDTGNARRLSAGDLAGFAGTIGSAPRLAGLQVARDFSLNDTVLDRPAYTLNGQTELPATLDVFVDGQKRLSEQLSGGQYEVRDLDVSTSGSDVDLVLTNALGEREVIRTRLFGNAFQLAEGASDFSFEAGAARLSENRYDGHFAAGTYRYGWLPWLASELHGESGEDGFALGSAAVSLNTVFGRLLLGAGASSQRRDDRRQTGTQTRASWAMNGRVGDRLNLGISADASVSDDFRRYRSVAAAPDVARLSAYASVPGFSLRGSYTEAGGIRSAQSEILLGRGSLTLLAGGQYFFNSQDWLTTLTLSWQPTRPLALPNLAYRHSLFANGAIAALQASDYLPETQTSYSVTGARQQSRAGEVSDQGSLQLGQSWDDLQASYVAQQNRTSSSHSLTLASAIVWQDGSPYATSYVGERQGYVSVHAGLPGVRLTQGIVDEYTDERGIAVFTLPAFSRSDIRLDPDSLPAGYRADGSLRTVSVMAGARAEARYALDTPGFFLRIPGFAGRQIRFNGRDFPYGPQGAFVVSGQVGSNQLVWDDQQRQVQLRSLRTDTPTYVLDRERNTLMRLMEAVQP